MKIKSYEGSRERRILTAMIVNDYILARIAPKWGQGLFASRMGNVVGNLCIQYFEKFEKAPMGDIETLFEDYAETAHDKESITLADKFLTTLSDEYEIQAQEMNVDYTLELASKLFNYVKLEKFREEHLEDISPSDVEGVQSKMSEYEPFLLGTQAGVDVLTDELAMERAFERQQEALVTFRGDLGKFYGKSLGRDSFIAYMAPEKRGKSWVLGDLAWQAMRQRRKVVFFSMGDLTEAQMMMRFMVRAARHPTETGSINFIKSIGLDDEEDPESMQAEDVEERIFKRPLDKQKAMKAFASVTRGRLRSKQSYLKLFTYPSDSMSIRDLENVLYDLDRVEEWSPDVIIIDYADIVLPPSSENSDIRHGINGTWKHMASMRMKFHALVATATQADISSLTKKVMDGTNFSEDKRKAAHVTGMVGLNQTPAEKQQQLMRYNWIYRRDGPFMPVVTVATCFGLARACTVSTF